MKNWVQRLSVPQSDLSGECYNGDDISWYEAVNTILGFQNAEHDYAIRIGLCDSDYTPGTFTINEISNTCRFLECPINFEEWISKAIDDEIELIKKYYPSFYDPEVVRDISPKIISILNRNSKNCTSLKNRIWYQEYPDIIRRLILYLLIDNPEQDLDIYPHLKNERSELIFDVLDLLEERNLELLDWLHLSIAAGLLGIDEKTVHAATSTIDTHIAICLPHSMGYTKFDVERIANDLSNAAQSKYRIDASNTFFQILDLNCSADFCIVSLVDDYLETIVLLKYYQKLLEKYPKIKIFCVPKSTVCGNDATYEDVLNILKRIPALKNNNRFYVVPNGPNIGGCNLLKLNKDVLHLLNRSQLLDVRGARNYEMLQGINKETFFGFMVCREISESVTGLSADKLPFIYLHQPAKQKTFDKFKERYKRIENGKMIALKTVMDNQLKWE